MQPGYSKLLINEFVVPDVGATWLITSMDWLMMALGAVKECTEKQWRTLLGEAGLKVVGIWTYDQGTESLIEAHTRSLIYRQIKSKHEHFSSRPEKLSKAIAVLPFHCLAERPATTTLSYSMDVCRI